MAASKKEDLSSNQDNSRIKASFKAGLLTGFVSKLLIHPIDTIKAHIIVNQKRIGQDTFLELGMFQTAKKINKSQGIKGFFQGAGLACVI